jgi:hypothetical protein
MRTSRFTTEQIVGFLKIVDERQKADSRANRAKPTPRLEEAVGHRAS